MSTMTAIPFLDLKAQYRSIARELQDAVSNTLASCSYAMGPSVVDFERAFAAYCGAKHAIAVNSGTSALHVALLAAGIGEGDEVITVPMTFVATVAAILYARATPRYVDIDPMTWTMDIGQLEAAITPRTKAIVPVHLHGRVADMDTILAIARAHGLVVIEDAAQAHGAEYKGRRAGSMGAAGCFSFYPGKNLGACGEGGAVVTDRDDLAEQMRMLRDWGQSQRYCHVVQGFNYRMDGVQGAALGVKLRHLEEWNDGRRRVAAAYMARLAESKIGLPASFSGHDHVWHVFAVRVPERSRVQQALADAGVSTGIHYPCPVHLQPAYLDPHYPAGSMPVSEAFAAETLSLPIFPELTDGQIDRVCECLVAACSGTRDLVVAA